MGREQCGLVRGCGETGRRDGEEDGMMNLDFVPQGPWETLKVVRKDVTSGGTPAVTCRWERGLLTLSTARARWCILHGILRLSPGSALSLPE